MSDTPGVTAGNSELARVQLGEKFAAGCEELARVNGRAQWGSLTGGGDVVHDEASDTFTWTGLA
ncbi:hypothetical protein AB0F25_30405 [Streptomyces wedmorensis]|uniref:hypothetical protein n=1 Tax=Streptomyces wedmorensis TaxID=43759 RepID=UPI0034304372